MPVLRTLSDDDVVALREMLAWFNRTGERSAGRDARDLDTQEQQAPDFYIVKIPVSGLPAFNVGTGTPGTASDVPVYRKVVEDGGTANVMELVAGMKITSLFNASAITFVSGDFAEARRDKYGVWWAYPMNFPPPPPPPPPPQPMWYDPVRYASTVNVSLAATGSRVLDGGINMTGTNVRVLLKNQTSATQNGIYLSQIDGSLLRAADMPSGLTIAAATVRVMDGATQSSSTWSVASQTPFAVNGAAMTWYRLDKLIGGYGTNQIGPTTNPFSGYVETKNRVTTWKAANSTTQNIELADSYIQLQTRSISHEDITHLVVRTAGDLNGTSAGHSTCWLSATNTNVGGTGYATLSLAPNDYSDASDGWVGQPFSFFAMSTSPRTHVSAAFISVEMKDPAGGAGNITVRLDFTTSTPPSGPGAGTYFSTLATQQGWFQGDGYIVNTGVTGMKWGISGTDPNGSHFANGILHTMGTGPTTIDGGTF